MIKIFIWIFFIFPFCFAQSKSQLKSDLQKLIDNSKNYYKSITKFDTENLKRTTFFLSAVTSSIPFDLKIKNLVQKEYDSTSIFTKFDSYYHIEFMSSTIILTYLYGNLSADDDLRDLSIDLLSSGILTVFSTYILKVIFGRSRPYLTDNQYEFNWLEFKDDKLSFPSGHTSLAFSFSTIMAEQSKNFLWKTLWFSSAGLVAFSRMYNNKHWFSDVLMGAIIGYFTSRFLINQGNSSNNNLNLPENIIVFRIKLN
jgi:hypothetical protein